ncbi:hypothetical protein FBQ97_21805 [Acidobacteria bacterium ACD]|nr:MAG: hypothetical protein EDX89_13490 [Acidobacteriota bacterium]MCE7959020.1 hypothetical protein [Acidobacteria bacterium ACB2]MDL1952421.1 hypothetical protein [Acidobacteria bacterium ACD]
MRRVLPLAVLLWGLSAAPVARAQDEIDAGAFVGGAGTVAGDGIDSPGLSFGLAGQYRPGASVVAPELRVGFRSYESTEGGGPQYRDFDHDQVVLSFGVRLFVAPRSRHSLFFSIGGIAAPGRTTVTQHFRPFPHPIPDEVTEESGVALGGYAGAGLDLRVSDRVLVVLDVRFEYQAGVESGDPDAGFLGGTVAVAYRFPAGSRR